MQPLTGDDPAEIGGYRLQARLGAGGMGRVYLAATPAGRPVALKVVRPELSDDQEFRARFRQEIQAAQRVHGLYTAQVVDADPAATQPWLVTAYVPGPSLEQAIEAHGPMPAAMVLRLIAGVAEALQAIHAADVVHRDLKPSNVLLAQDGPRVIDFGIARALEAASLTHPDIMMGTPDFLAPEQILDLPISPAIDIFALGSLAVYAAAGRPPFGHGHATAISHRVIHEAPGLDGCPAQLVTLIGACLEKQPEARPALGQIIEFCVARAPGIADSSQPWLAWGPARSVPESGAAVSTGKKDWRNLRFGAAVATAVLIAALIAIPVTLHLTAAGHPLTPGVHVSSPAPSRAPTPVRSATVSPPARPRSTASALLAATPPAAAQVAASLKTAEADLNSGSQATQLNGISLLRGIMASSPGEQPTGLGALERFIHVRSPAGDNDRQVTIVVQTAVNALRDRNPAHDDGFTFDFDNTNFTSANLSGIDLDDATLVNTDFSSADLGGASLRGANLSYAFLGGADLDGMVFQDADLSSASFYQTIMCDGSAPVQSQDGYNCSASG
jgi:serine/threonine protein kinase